MGLEQQAEVSEVKDIKALIAKGILLTPALVIDGIKVSVGRIPSREEIKKWIKETK